MILSVLLFIVAVTTTLCRDREVNVTRLSSATMNDLCDNELWPVAAMQPQKMSLGNLKYRCYRDAPCSSYGDCCWDAVSKADPSNQTLAELEDALLADSKKLQWEWECHLFPAANRTNMDVYMIASCPTGYTNAIILNRCRRRVPPPEHDYLLDLPVLSQKTNITYVNVYCALCNDDNQLYKMELGINCPLEYLNCSREIYYWTYVPWKREWHFPLSGNATREKQNLSITYEIVSINSSHMYYQEFGLRNCHADVIGTCPANWMKNKEYWLCLSYSLTVMEQNTKRLYKNAHCAICNGESVNHLTCPKERVGAPGSPGIPANKGHTYAILLDFLGTGSYVGKAGECGIERLVCGFGELCDQLHKACRAYTCGRLYHMSDDGHCVAIKDNQTHHSTFHSLESDCPKFFVAKDNFVHYSNNSVFIKSIKRLYNSSQYEVVNSTTILICTSFDSYSWTFPEIQSILSKIFIIPSLLSLVAHIVIHIITPPLLNLPGKNLLCLSISLLVAQLCFEFGINVTSSNELCIMIGLLIHFGFLAAFLWMNVIAIDVYRTFASTTNSRSYDDNATKNKFRNYSIYAWSTAAILVLMAVINDVSHWMPGYEPLYGYSFCWINNRHALLIFFAAPLAIILMANMVFFTITVMAISRTRKAAKFAHKASKRDDKARIFLYFKLALIMGLTWIVGFVAELTNVDEIWYIFILINCLQGVFIFIAFSCKKTVIRLIPGMPCRRICHCGHNI